MCIKKQPAAQLHRCNRVFWFGLCSVRQEQIGWSHRFNSSPFLSSFLLNKESYFLLAAILMETTFSPVPDTDPLATLAWIRVRVTVLQFQYECALLHYNLIITIYFQHKKEECVIKDHLWTQRGCIDSHKTTTCKNETREVISNDAHKLTSTESCCKKHLAGVLIKKSAVIVCMF